MIKLVIAETDLFSVASHFSLNLSFFSPAVRQCLLFNSSCSDNVDYRDFPWRTCFDISLRYLATYPAGALTDYDKIRSPMFPYS